MEKAGQLSQKFRLPCGSVVFLTEQIPLLWSPAHWVLTAHRQCVQFGLRSACAAFVLVTSGISLLNKPGYCSCRIWTSASLPVTVLDIQWSWVKIQRMKQLRADYIRGIPAAICSRNFCLPAWCLIIFNCDGALRRATWKWWIIQKDVTFLNCIFCLYTVYFTTKSPWRSSWFWQYSSSFAKSVTIGLCNCRTNRLVKRTWPQLHDHSFAIYFYRCQTLYRTLWHDMIYLLTTKLNRSIQNVNHIYTKWYKIEPEEYERMW